MLLGGFSISALAPTTWCQSKYSNGKSHSNDMTHIILDSSSLLSPINLYMLTYMSWLFLHTFNLALLFFAHSTVRLDNILEDLVRDLLNELIGNLRILLLLWDRSLISYRKLLCNITVTLKSYGQNLERMISKVSIEF